MFSVASGIFVFGLRALERDVGNGSRSAEREREKENLICVAKNGAQLYEPSIHHERKISFYDQTILFYFNVFFFFERKMQLHLDVVLKKLVTHIA